MKTTAGRWQLHVYLDYEKSGRDMVAKIICTSSIQ